MLTGSQAAAPPSVQRTASRRTGLRQAILILLIAQFGLGIGVNLYVTLPAAGNSGHASWFGNGPLLALHTALGMFLILSAIFVLVRAIRAKDATLMVTSTAALVAILLAAFFRSGCTDKFANGYFLGMAIAFAVAVACYAIGLYPASRRHDGHDRARERLKSPVPFNSAKDDGDHDFATEPPG